MAASVENRSAGKRRAIVEAATRLFLEKGYDGASMDDVAALAAVSKPTVYNHFADKEELFAEVVYATTDRVDGLVRLVAGTLTEAADLEAALSDLARQFIAVIMNPETLRLRRLVIANADRFPHIGRAWYEKGFERVLTTLATCFKGFSDRGMLRIDDPLMAADHFVGLLLWIPVNRAMFTGNHRSRKVDLDRYSAAAVRAFLDGYGLAPDGKEPIERLQRR
jgi:TetR/AcrR family transcriptional repressor of mexJK operon